jgi:hypothetical protein
VSIKIFSQWLKHFKSSFFASWAFDRSRRRDKVNGAFALITNHLCSSWKAGQPDFTETAERFFILNDIVLLPLVTSRAIDECSETVNRS